jgi:hypothetical protein
VRKAAGQIGFAVQHVGGWWRGSSPGSDEIAVSHMTSRPPSPLPKRSSTPLPLCCCSEGSAVADAIRNRLLEASVRPNAVGQFCLMELRRAPAAAPRYCEWSCDRRRGRPGEDDGHTQESEGAARRLRDGVPRASRPSPREDHGRPWE